jgi:hypothetical protein
MMSVQRTSASYLLLTLVMAICVAPSVSPARDWYQWRGPEQNGVSRETNLPEKWTLDGENVLWTAPVPASPSGNTG